MYVYNDNIYFATCTNIMNTLRYKLKSPLISITLKYSHNINLNIFHLITQIYITCKISHNINCIYLYYVEF